MRFGSKRKKEVTQQLENGWMGRSELFKCIGEMFLRNWFYIHR